MSQLLGRRDCIESLRRDLVDLQAATLDVFSRTGPVRFPSWKFPDRLSCHLDMVALLEQYDFVDGEDAFNQHSHIVLLELVIDRLLLLLQSFNVYVEQIRRGHRGEQTQQRGCLSVGLVVRNYWSNLVHYTNFKGTYKNTKKQTKSEISECDETESSRSEVCRHCSSARSSASSFRSLPQNYASSSPTHVTPCPPKSVNVSCQTFESSLVPCDACHQAQCTLRKTGDALVELFQSEGLPSSLQPLLVAVKDTLQLGHMTAGDVAQWANEQLRDMRRLARHLQDVRGTVQPLTERLAVAEAERERFKSQLETTQREFTKEVQKLRADTVQLEFSLRKAQRSSRETEQRLQEELQKLQRETLSLEESNCRLKEKVAEQQHALQALECERSELQDKVRTLQVEEEACCKLQQRIQQLEAQVSETQLCLDKESAKYNSACRQQESMQAKQSSLLKRVDALDEECEELQRQLDKSEEKRCDLHQQLQQVSEEREQVQTQLAQQQDLCLKLQKEKQTAEERVGELKDGMAEMDGYVRALKERERLLVAFPELSPLSRAQPQSTGNVVLDMEQQLQANSIRIKVLEQENTTLHGSLVKLRETARNDANRQASPQESWSSSLPGTPTEKQQNHLPQTQTSPLPSGSAARLRYSDRRREARRGESGVESAGSEDHVSPAAASPSSLQLHLQTLQLNSGAVAAKSHTKARSGSLFSQATSRNQRKK